MQPQYQQQQHFQPQQQYHAAAPSQPPLWMPPMDQAAAYEALFREADPANAGTVAGGPAVEFLRRSALPDETLRLVHSVLIIFYKPFNYCSISSCVNLFTITPRYGRFRIDLEEG